MRNEMKSASGGRKRRGFTLIELLVVIAIIGILAVLIFLALERSREAARDSQRKAMCRDIATAEAIYYDSNKSYTRLLTELTKEPNPLISADKIPPVCPTGGDFGDRCKTEWQTALSGGGRSFKVFAVLERGDNNFQCDQNGCGDVPK